MSPGVLRIGRRALWEFPDQSTLGCNGPRPLVFRPEARRMNPSNTLPSRCAIVLRTYWKDLPWFALALRSIVRFAHGFSEVVVAMPETSRAWFVRDVDALEACRASDAKLVFVATVADDYLGQQITKLQADTFTDAEFIAHVDSDCIFNRPTTAAELVAGGRPRIVTCTLDELGRHHPWRAPTEAFLGEAVAFDYMQQPPFVYPRGLYGRVRAFCIAQHDVTIERYVGACPPRGFSEFNVLGAYAHRHAPELLEFVSRESAPKPCCDWYWSWGGLDAGSRQRIERALADSPTGSAG